MSAFALMMRSVGLLAVAYSFENRCISYVLEIVFLLLMAAIAPRWK